MAALELGASRRRRLQAAPPRPCAVARRRVPAARQASSTSSGTTKGAAVPAQRLAGAGDLVGAERRSRGPCGCRPWSGAPKPMMVLQAISVGRSGRCAPLRWRAAIASGSWPSTVDRVPAGGLEAGDLVGRVRTATTAPSMVMLLSSHSTISLLSFRWPASAIASWLMPSIRQPSPAMHIGVVVDQIVAEAGVQDALGHRHADGVGDALAERAGGGLDAGGVAVFRVAGGRGSRAGGNS